MLCSRSEDWALVDSEGEAPAEFTSGGRERWRSSLLLQTTSSSSSTSAPTPTSILPSAPDEILLLYVRETRDGPTGLSGSSSLRPCVSSLIHKHTVHPTGHWHVWVNFIYFLWFSELVLWFSLTWLWESMPLRKRCAWWQLSTLRVWRWDPRLHCPLSSVCRGHLPLTPTASPLETTPFCQWNSPFPGRSCVDWFCFHQRETHFPLGQLLKHIKLTKSSGFWEQKRHSPETRWHVCISPLQDPAISVPLPGGGSAGSQRSGCS